MSAKKPSKRDEANTTPIP
jgi:hypothetical protein